MIIEIDSIDIPPLAPYRALSSAKRDPEGVVIAESPKVIHRALDAGLHPLSLLCERKHIEGDAAPVISRIGETPVYTGERHLLESLTGYTLTRGVLCAFARPREPQADVLLRHSKRVCVIYEVCDATNVGVIFRTAAALGYDAVIVSSRSCDPFNRRATRVSMGTVFQIPWAFADDVTGTLRNFGFLSVSMALSDESIYLQDFKVEPQGKYALLLGSEGYGLPDEIIADSDHVVKIPMYHGVDSLNVGAAAAITLWHFRNFSA